MKKISCSEVKELLTISELRIELNEEERKSVEEHLSECESCRQTLAEEKQLSEFLDDGFISIARESNELAGQISSSLPAQIPPKTWAWPLSRLESLAAMILFSIGIFVGWLINGESNQPLGTGNKPNSILSKTSNPAVQEYPQYISMENRAHEFLPKDTFKTSEKRKLILRFPGTAHIRIEVDHQESLLEDLKKPASPQTVDPGKIEF